MQFGRAMANHQLWCTRQLTVRVTGPDGERTIDVGKPYARIGSHSRSEVILEGLAVPKHGLYLHATQRGIFCTQLRESSPDEEAFHGWLTSDHGIAIGDYQIYASFSDGDEPEVDPDWILDQKGSAQLPVPVIYVLVNEERRATYRAYRSLTVVGREHPSALRLRSEFISSTHCVLYWQSGKLWFVDLLSSNGTEKRGRRCEAERVRLGRTIKIGDVLLGFARTTDQPWSATADDVADHEESTHLIESRNIFELHAPPLVAAQLADSRGSFSGSESSLSGIDALGVGLAEEPSLEARLHNGNRRGN